MKLLKNTKIQTAVLLGVILVLVVPYIGACFCAFPAADDYAAALEYQAYVREHGPSLFNPVKAAVYRTVNYGQNFIFMIHYLLSPLLNGGLPALRVWLCVSLLFLCACLVYLAVALCRSFWKGCTVPKVLLLTALFLFLFFGLSRYQEVYFWFTCSVSYGMTAGAICLAVAFLLEWVRKGGWLRLALSVLFAAFASLSATNVGTLCCFVLLLIALWAFFIKKCKPVVWLPLLAAVLVTLLYLLMPGVRTRTNGAPLPYVGALGHAFGVVMEQLQRLFAWTVFPVLLLAFAAFVWHNAPDKNNARLWHLPVLALLGVVIPVVVTYPVSLGYRLGGLSSRCLFVTDMALYFSLLLVTAYLVLYLKSRPWLQRNQAVVGKGLALAACVWCAVSLAFATSPFQYPFVMLSRELYSGKLEANRKVWESQLDSYYDSPGEDLIVFYDDNVFSSFILYYRVLPELDNWVNRAVAEYYGLRSISATKTFVP